VHGTACPPPSGGAAFPTHTPLPRWRVACNISPDLVLLYLTAQHRTTPVVPLQTSNTGLNTTLDRPAIHAPQTALPAARLPSTHVPTCPLPQQLVKTYAFAAILADIELRLPPRLTTTSPTPVRYRQLLRVPGLLRLRAVDAYLLTLPRELPTACAQLLLPPCHRQRFPNYPGPALLDSHHGSTRYQFYVPDITGEPALDAAQGGHLFALVVRGFGGRHFTLPVSTSAAQRGIYRAAYPFIAILRCTRLRYLPHYVTTPRTYCATFLLCIAHRQELGRDSHTTTTTGILPRVPVSPPPATHRHSADPAFYLRALRCLCWRQTQPRAIAPTTVAHTRPGPPHTFLDWYHPSTHGGSL